MKITDALRIVQANKQRDSAALEVFLAVGFTPLHLRTLLLAQLARRAPDRRIEVLDGVYGDLAKCLEAPEALEAAGTVVIVEWADLDPRLGLRRLGGWTHGTAVDILASVKGRLALLRTRIGLIAEHRPVALSTPTLPLPPIFSTSEARCGALELALRLDVMNFAADCAALPNARVSSTRLLDRVSPLGGRHNIAGELNVDFPYKVEHASALAAQMARLVLPPPALKGVITDLDDTLWRGLVGELGPDGVTWSLEGHAQPHALYQQTLAALADQGILVAVASKNTPRIAREALQRKDMLLPVDRVFPLEINWDRKSDSVERILRAWNVDQESVVFVDDSAVELEEVRSRFPRLRCLQFDATDPNAALDLMRLLRDWCYKDHVSTEDRLRLDSIRSGHAYREAVNAGSDFDTFLAGLSAELDIDSDKNPASARPLELINKTNQFNLNGRRVDLREWQSLLARPTSFVLTISYRDKFGALGEIAVVAGERRDRTVHVDHWVQSCRAFSRRIEHRTLLAVFELYNADAVTFAVKATDRNKPLMAFLVEELKIPAATGDAALQREQCLTALIGQTGHLVVDWR